MLAAGSTGDGERQEGRREASEGNPAHDRGNLRRSCRQVERDGSGSPKKANAVGAGRRGPGYDPAMTRVRWVGAMIVALGVAAAVESGCAAERASESPTPASPASAPAPAGGKEQDELEPATIEQAQAQLERARTVLAGTPAAGPQGAPGGSATAPSHEETKKGEKTPQLESEEQRRAADGCTTACNAMASMRRAVDAICRMAGDGDARCTSARRTLEDSHGRVVACGCG
jgi:hypothetical protein